MTIVSLFSQLVKVTRHWKLKKGRYLYDTQLAATIAKLAGINFEERVANGESKSVSVGSYEINTLEDDENFKVAVISFDHQSE